MEMVMPRAFSSGALSIWSKGVKATLGLDSARTLVMAAVRVVLPWSMWPIVPTLRWGLDRSNFCFAMSLASHAGHDLARDRLGNFLVGVELHGVRRATLGARTQVGSVAEHVREGHLCPDDLARPPLVHPGDLAPPPGEVADDVAHVVLGRHHLNGHDRLEQDGAGLACALLERHRARDAERHLPAVDLVVGAVDQRDPPID